ncbi:MAG: IS4 family transposase [Cytophagales bacterium]|nr:IS4 family transposase [Cytophagales bacterium]
MSNEVRLFKVVARMINKFLPGMLEANRVTLAYLITGIIGSKDVQLRQVANKVVYPGKETSLVERFRRFLQNKNIVVKIEFNPFIELILSGLSQSRLVLAIDSTKVGGGCICLMVSIVYKSRALPICWVVFKGRKGHSSAEIQLTLIKTLQSLLPTDREVIILGDGEFDGSELVSWFEQQITWRYVCRTANRIKIRYQDEWLALTDLDLVEAEETFLTDLLFTQTGQVGPLNILVVWNKKEQEHWFFVTNFSNPKEAKKWYRKRFSIETLFSDVKGRGFNLDKTRIWKSERVDHLIFAVAIAYIFTVFLGVELIMRGPFEKLFRTDRFYHSLFQLGLSHLNYLLKSCLPIPELGPLPPPDSFEHVVLAC